MKDKLSTIPINQEEIATYLKDIRKIKVLTPERERTLSERMLSSDLTLTEKHHKFKLKHRQNTIFAKKNASHSFE